MRLLKSLSFSGISTATRLAAALISFAIVARALGPAQFGTLALCLSIATLLTILSNFGLVTYLLREIGRQPEAAAEIFGDTWGAKLQVTAVAMLAGVIALPFMESGARLPYVLLLAAMIAEGFSELFNAGLRARNRYDVEAWLALVAGVLYALSVGLTAWWTNSLSAIAVAYFASRTIVAILTWRQLSRVIGPVQLASMRDAWRRVRASISYAVDAGLTSMFGQVDSLVLNHYLGAHAVGINQAGARLFSAGAQAAPVLLNVFLPRLSMSIDDARELRRLLCAFAFLGLTFGALLCTTNEWLVEVIYGSAFAELASLMPLFAVLFVVRFGAAPWGVVLTAQGHQSFRAAASALHWVIGLSAAAILVPAMGIAGWLFALIVANVSLQLLYAFRATRRFGRYRLEFFVSGLSQSGFMLAAYAWGRR